MPGRRSGRGVAASWKTSRVRWNPWRTTARNSSRFVPNSWNRYGCETPTARAIDSVEVPL